MNETDYIARLYEKMKAEQDKYRDWLLHQEPPEILNHTFEYTMREDIVMCMEELELEPEKARALLRSPCPLSDVYAQSGIHGQIGACKAAEHFGHPAFLYHQCGCRSRTDQGRFQPCTVCQ